MTVDTGASGVVMVVIAVIIRVVDGLGAGAVLVVSIVIVVDGRRDSARLTTSSLVNVMIIVCMQLEVEPVVAPLLDVIDEEGEVLNVVGGRAGEFSGERVAGRRFCESSMDRMSCATWFSFALPLGSAGWKK